MGSFFINPDIAKARTIDTSFYTSPEYFASSREKIFAPSWQFIGDASLLPVNEYVHPFTLLPQYIDEPLLLTRDSQDRVRCMSNVCTHRGNLLAWQPCRTPQLRCKYHGRQFGLDGCFKSMPEFREVEHFPTAADSLHQLPLFTWGRLLFTSLHPVQDSHVYFSEMLERMSWYPIDQLQPRPDLDKTYHVPAHWALYCENYLEGFHIPFVHEGLNQALDYSGYTTEVFNYCNLQLGLGKKGEDCFTLPPTSPDYGKDVAAYYFWVFPNMMFNFYPWGLSINIVEPLTTDTCRVRFITYVCDETRLNTGAGNGLDTTEMEDEEVVAHVQQGIRSRYYHHGRYSVTREQGTHHFHSLLAAAMNG